jgi:hydrogenase maturation protein HypF
MICAQSIRVRGIVQGVGFRPFVYRLAQANTLTGWVSNQEEGVEIHLEGDERGLNSFLRDLTEQPPPAACITAIDVQKTEQLGLRDFVIREGQRRERPSTRISRDLPVCEECLAELFDPRNRRYGYSYINCTDCGPRYSIILGLPYDRNRTTMGQWSLDEACASQYHDPIDRRFHAQPIACPACGPSHFLRSGNDLIKGDAASIGKAADLLNTGAIVAIKGLGGYHLACDAKNRDAVAALRDRKFRKEKPFALMVRSLALASDLLELSEDAAMLMKSPARPIVLAHAKVGLEGVAPDNDQLGIMLPYTPLHHLLFAAGAPEILVLTSANRSSEPIAYLDDDAAERLASIADAFLIGERPIARRLDDSIVRAGAFGPVILRRSRGYAPSCVSQLPTRRPILAVGADLKNAVTLGVDGQAFVSQHIGDLEHLQSFQAFKRTIDDLLTMYEIRRDEVLVVRDSHPEYVSTMHACAITGSQIQTVQHHRAHVASVLAERQAWSEHVIGVSFDGTGYGDDGAIWGGEIFCGTVEAGFNRVAHLRYATLPGGDAAAHHPAQAAAGFLAQLDGLPDLSANPFWMPGRFGDSLQLVRKGVRSFPTTSVGRLFDTAAALLGFTRAISFEGQAAMWVEQLARKAPGVESYAFPFSGVELDFRPLLQCIIEDRLRGRDLSRIARAFQRGLAEGLCNAVRTLSAEQGTETVVLSGGVFQNELLLDDLKSLFEPTGLRIWTNHLVPPNDGGISLGQAVLAAAAIENAPCTNSPSR